MPASKSPKAPKVSYCCTECGWSSPKWMGQCRECREWGTLEETQVSDSPGGGAGGALGAAGAVRPTVAARPIGEVSATEARARPTGVGELDRVLGGGIVPGAVVLLAGEPGVGKSTLLLDVAAKTAAVARERGDGPVLYVTGEESASQVRLRAERIDALDPGRSWPRRPSWEPCWGTWRQPVPPCWWWTRFRPSPQPRSRAVPGASPRCGPWPVRSSR